MSALLAPSLSLLQERNHLDPLESCRFCRCTKEHPCLTALREDDNGNFVLARNESETEVLEPCYRLAPRVCTAPECMEKLLLEKRSRPILFEASGRRVNG